MSDSGEDRDRQLVPRWRSFASAAEFGELQPLTTQPADSVSAELLTDVIED
jgi:hypothetical protein